ncbi:substrate-binding domain-containing protein [Lignipirellula cremea]|uniref:D-ribose-binding periplasmic protein n=1 Tax=Lignipirellula cremea TaxID=2528010 RepID=A0A518DX26_9BACT|nr:substrate-binding domain-containing protein [Lignipirellula cremea]QDU96389.1 D-ribose-binding periplasmic protein precursor [Lignipirellula cremea]
MFASLVRSIVGFSLLLAVVCVAGCSSGGDGAPTVKRVVFLNNTDSPFWDAFRAGLNEGEKEFKLADSHLKVSWESNDGETQSQIEKLRQFAAQTDIAAVGISVLQADNPAIAGEIKNLRNQGVKVITVDGDINRELFPDVRDYYIGTDNTIGGKVLGTAVRELLKAKGGDGGCYVQFAGYTDNDNARSRMDGVKEAIGDVSEERDRMPDQTKRDKAANNVRNALNHEDLKALVGIWSYNATAITDVVQDKGVRDQVIIGCFDAEPGAIEAMSNGLIDVIVVQDPYNMGRQTARLLQALVVDDKATVKEMFPTPDQVGGDNFTTALRVVRLDEKSPLELSAFEGVVAEENFMTLEQFKAWLDKYGLSGS